MSASASTQPRPTDPTSSFPPLRSIIHPAAGRRHTHTAILLHGRGSTGPEFSEELFERDDSCPDYYKALNERFPGFRWVFPSSKTSWNDLFQEDMAAWFEVYSLSDPTEKQELQTSGIAESVAYLKTVIQDEIDKLDGDAGRLGAAVGMLTLLSLEQRVGGFFGASTWLPFASDIRHHLGATAAKEEEREDVGGNPFAVLKTALGWQKSNENNSISGAVMKTPVWLGHGIDDVWVDVWLGRQARDTLKGVGFEVVGWKEYEGAENDGHWFKIPEEIDDVAEFLASVTGSASSAQ
ncbi:beta-1,4-glucosidase [Pholiota molesta]|nr:beta-1,4-glucosidase [Pholiota molesta]